MKHIRINCNLPIELYTPGPYESARNISDVYINVESIDLVGLQDEKWGLYPVYVNGRCVYVHEEDLNKIIQALQDCQS